MFVSRYNSLRFIEMDAVPVKRVLPKTKRTNLPRRVKNMSPDVLALTLKKKKECNAKALQIVEGLLEGSVVESYLLENLRYINDSHFQDVVEERVILKLCGYPLCQSKLKQVPGQKYHISTKLNKVYDITDRKNFCSNICYKAAKYLKEQLLTSPLWLRDNEEVPEFKLLPIGSCCGSSGEEIDFGLTTSIKNEDYFISVLQYTNESINKLSCEDNKPSVPFAGKNCDLENENSLYHVDTREDHVSSVRTDYFKLGCLEKSVISNVPTKNESENSIVKCVSVVSESSKNHYHLSNKLSDNESYVISKNILDEILHFVSYKCEKMIVKESTANEYFAHLPKQNEENSKETFLKANSNKNRQRETLSKKMESKKNKIQNISLDHSIVHVEKCLNEWFTLDSMIFLFGEENMKELICDKGDCIKEYYKGVGTDSWDPQMKERYNLLCRRLNILEFEDCQYDKEVRNESVSLKPLPDYKMIQEEGRRMNIRVAAFYKGRTYYENVPDATNDIEDASSAVVLPLIDFHAQKSHRRRIVLDRLSRVLPDMLRTLGLSSRDVSTDVRRLVNSFSLGAQNITFRPAEWSLIGLIIIKLLTIKDSRLKYLLEAEQPAKYISMMMLAFQQDGGYLDRLLAWLTDIDNILQKQKILDSF